MSASLQLVTKKIQECCPELLELSFGCQYKVKSRPGIFTIRGDFERGIVKGLAPEIIGHPIRLEHVLRAIYEKHPSFHNYPFIDCNGSLNNGYGRICKWNLTKPLSEQDEKVIEFLADILK